MNATVVIAVAVFLLGATIGAFALLVIGIRRGDHSTGLSERPHTRTDAITRRFIGVGIRHDSYRDESERS